MHSGRRSSLPLSPGPLLSMRDRLQYSRRILVNHVVQPAEGHIIYSETGVCYVMLSGGDITIVIIQKGNTTCTFNHLLEKIRHSLGSAPSG